MSFAPIVSQTAGDTDSVTMTPPPPPTFNCKLAAGGVSGRHAALRVGTGHAWRRWCNTSAFSSLWLFTCNLQPSVWVNECWKSVTIRRGGEIMKLVAYFLRNPVCCVSDSRFVGYLLSSRGPVRNSVRKLDVDFRCNDQRYVFWKSAVDFSR